MASVHQRYRVIEKIDAGGMAEIYRGEAISLEGFSRTVAIKRILPSMCRDKKFIAMFLDEAKLSMQLQHANIVQIFDIGKADDTYFVVMELIEGVNLRRMMQRAIDRGIQVPVSLACYLLVEVAKALAYAHEKRDGDGNMLGIVHRDVSPPNVLISRQGEVKLTDFGLAKAASHSTKTEAGVIKGKFSYLSPEVVAGKTVDPRADVYSAGIIAWELLCGRKLFHGSNDMETVELVRKGLVPKPSEIRDDVDPELDRVLLKALAKNPKRRYQSARALEQGLLQYLFKNNMAVTASDVADFLAVLRGEGEEVAEFDVLTLLNAELSGLERTGKIDGTTGQVPLRPSSLSNPGSNSLPIADLDAVIERVTSLPLEDMAADLAGSSIMSLAERLEKTDDTSQTRDRIQQAIDAQNRSIAWKIALAAAAATLAVVGIGVYLWQTGILA
jgi:serine/threonine protein kinase